MRYFRYGFWLIAIITAVIFSPSAQAEMQGKTMATTPNLLFSMKHRMSYLGERQALLSKNIANANTPHYKAQDLAPMEGGSHQLKLYMTNPRHISLNMGSADFKQIERDTFETTPMGNNVVLDEEMVKVSQNNMEYQETTNLYKKWGGLLKTAINGGK